MQFSIGCIFFLILNFSKTNQMILETSEKTNKNSNILLIKTRVNETYCAWSPRPPWKLCNDLFNDKPFNNSVEYFGINEEEHLNNESYIESSEINACHEMNITFYSRIRQRQIKMNLSLFLYNQNKWIRIWDYVYNDCQWIFHQLNIKLSNQSEQYVKLRFIPSLTSFNNISMAIAILNMSKYTKCHIDKSQLKSQASAKSNSSKYSSVLVLVGGLFSLILTAILFLFIYGFIERQCNRLARRRTERRQQNARKTKNAIRDESTVLSLGTHPV
ncbi:hypothetical protein I4U23_025099 [Adineta vaga]|nr:hypothetical protein I4U23_025099 [Adineta vaga]